MSSVPAVPVVEEHEDRRIPTSDDDQDTEITMPNEPYHDQEDEEERPEQSEGEQEEEDNEPARARLHSQNSYEASVVSTSSNPPPYELYPPAKTVFGRIYNWLRKIPSLNTHQPIYLPTIHNDNHSGRSIFSIRRRRRRDSSANSSISSANSVSCWSYSYFAITDRLPDCPRFVLPNYLAKRRLILVLASVFSLVLFSFLLFCSVYFAPTSYPDPTWPDKVTNSTARYLTLNIFMRPPLIRNNWSDYKDDRLAYIEKYILPEYDVITFQESFAFATRRKDHLITTARNLGFNYHIESPRKYPWQIGVDGGLLLISRFPIRQVDIIEYPRGQHSDWYVYLCIKKK
jgi:hypothetical protein